METAKLRKAAGISLVALGVLLLGALVFYKERMLLCDAPHIVFSIINGQELQVQQFRYGAFITQSVPLLASVLHLSLKAVLIAYSLSFNLFYFIVAAILIFRFKAYGLAVLFAFYLTLVASDTYYWTNNEIHQGIAWMFLCFGYIFSPGRQRDFSAVVVVLLLVGGMAIITHPLVMIPFIFLWGFFWIGKTHWPFDKKESVVLAVLVLLLVGAKFILSRYLAPYDRGLLHQVSSPSLQTVVNAFTSDMALDIAKHTVKNFWLVPVLFIAGLFEMLRQKRTLLAAYTTLFCLAYFIAICITFTGYLAFYTESELMPGSILATAPFVFFVLPRLKENRLAWIIAAIFLVRLCYIGYSSQKFTARIQALNNVLGQMEEDNITKLALIKKEDKVEPEWMLDWGVPVESLTLSALNGDRPQRHFIILKPERKHWVPEGTRQMITTHERWNINQLNKSYFLVDTTQPYLIKVYDEYIR